MVRSTVRLRLLTGEDADWMIDVDVASAGQTAHGHDWHPDKLRAALDEGYWATEDRVAWAVMQDGVPVGFALLDQLSTGAGAMELRILPAQRGKGVGRRVLGLLADHHFAEDPRLRRLTGKTHEANVPMQRAFVAAGFRMEARYRDSFEQPDGERASEWGYALTRDDWEAGRLSPATEFNLHARRFALRVDPAAEVTTDSSVVIRVLQEGRRVIAAYDGTMIHDGEAAGLLLDDTLVLSFVHDIERRGEDPHRTVGQAQARVQRLGDGRLELLAAGTTDDGVPFELHLVEVR